MNEQTLEVTSISEVMTAKDNRSYAVIGVQEPSSPGLISTTRPHKKVIWSHQPNQGPDSENPNENRHFDQIVKAMEKNGTCKITGSVQTVETEPYFIENESGKDVHPETNAPANKVTQKTYVVFPDESVDRLLANDELKRKGASEEEAMRANEELVAEDLGEELEEEAAVA